MFPQINTIMWRSDYTLAALIRVFSQSILMNYTTLRRSYAVSYIVVIVVYKSTVSHQCVALTTTDNAGSRLDSEDTGVSSASDSDKEAAIDVASDPSCSPYTISTERHVSPYLSLPVIVCRVLQCTNSAENIFTLN